MQEVECTGSGLNPDADVLTMTLYNALHNRILAYVNLNNKECSTSFLYSACVISPSDTRRSRLVALVTDLKDNEYVLLGCNISTFRSGLLTSVSWTVTIRRESTCYVFPLAVGSTSRYNVLPFPPLSSLRDIFVHFPSMNFLPRNIAFIPSCISKNLLVCPYLFCLHKKLCGLFLYRHFLFADIGLTFCFHYPLLPEKVCPTFCFSVFTTGN